MMVVTHMVTGLVLSSILFPLTGNPLVLFLGYLGGLLPDIDRLEKYGLTHRKSLHYPWLYLIFGIILIVLPTQLSRLSSSLFLGAWLHSVMDILDNPYGEDVSKGVYDHLRRKWIPALMLVRFADDEEWVLFSFTGAALIFIAGLEPQLLPLLYWDVGRSLLLAALYALGLIIGAVWDLWKVAPERREMYVKIKKKALP